MVKILRSLCRRREAYQYIKKDINLIADVAEKVSEYKNGEMNNMMLEIFRVLMLFEEDG